MNDIHKYVLLLIWSHSWNFIKEAGGNLLLLYKKLRFYASWENINSTCLY